MAIIHDQILDALKKADSFICSHHIFGFSLYQMGGDLVSSIHDDGYVPYVIGQNDRYRSSPLASCLFYLYDSNLLSGDSAKIMRCALFNIRDSMPPFETRPPRRKQSKDVDAWCVSEGASVWSTSMALIALLRSRVELASNKDEILIKSAEWLSKQQNKQSGGWPYQNTINSVPTVPLTALSIRALSSVLQIEAMSQHQRSTFEACIESGLTFLHSHMKRNHDFVYWCFDDHPNLTATIWATDAITSVPPRFHTDIPSQLVIKFAKNHIPKDNQEWKSDCFVREPKTEYSHQKSFYTFMPSLLPSLFRIGLSPSDPLALNIVERLIRDGRDKWRIKEYDMKPCTFAHAMALHVLINWAIQSQRELTTAFFCPFHQTKKTTTKCPIFKYNPKKCYANLKLRRAYAIYGLTFATLIIASIVNPSIYAYISRTFSFFWYVINTTWGITIAGGSIAALIVRGIYNYKNKKEK